MRIKAHRLSVAYDAKQRIDDCSISSVCIPDVLGVLQREHMRSNCRVRAHPFAQLQRSFELTVVEQVHLALSLQKHVLLERNICAPRCET
jgi:hypothetical protein